MTSKLTAEREAEARQRDQKWRGTDGPTTVHQWDRHLLLLALDAEREAHRETRAEAERLRGERDRGFCRAAELGRLRSQVLAERDEARRDAVEAVRLAGLAPRDLGTELANRIVTYREVPDDENPEPGPGA